MWHVVICSIRVPEVIVVRVEWKATRWAKFIGGLLWIKVLKWIYSENYLPFFIRRVEWASQECLDRKWETQQNKKEFLNFPLQNFPNQTKFNAEMMWFVVQGEMGPKGEPGISGNRGPAGQPGKRGKQVRWLWKWVMWDVIFLLHYFKAVLFWVVFVPPFIVFDLLFWAHYKYILQRKCIEHAGRVR